MEPSLVAKGKLTLVEGSKEEDDPCSVENILSMLKESDGMKKIGDLQLKRPSYDQDQIEKVLVDHLVQNSIALGDLTYVFLNVLYEVLKDHLKKPLEVAPVSEDDVQDDIEKRCAYAQKQLSKDIKNMSDCVAEAGRVYKYFLQQPTTIEHFKAKIDSN